MCDMTDFLYRKELSDNECKECLLKLRDFIGRPFYLSRLLSDSKTLQYLKPYSKIVGSHECVDIFWNQITIHTSNSYPNLLDRILELPIIEC